MKKVAIFIVVALLLFCAAPVYANGGPPGFPDIFYGDVTINGDPAPDGTQIKAMVAEGEVLTTSQNPVATENGNYGIDGLPLLVQGYDLSGAITFYVNGVEVEGATATFEAGGGPTRQDLDLVSDVTAQKVVTVPVGNDHFIDFSTEAGTTITVDTTGDVTITVQKYADNPHPKAEPPTDTSMLPSFIDIGVDNPGAVAWPMHVEQTYTDDDVVGLDESSLGICYFKADPPPNGVWKRCDNTGVWEGINTVWADIEAEELPGCPVGIGGAAPAEPEPEPPTGGGGGGDTTSPAFSNISASSISETTADIAWTTNEPSTSQVEYWTSPSILSPLDQAKVTNHHVQLIDLTPGSSYHYKTMSRDAAGNLAVSDEYTFATLEIETPPVPAFFVSSSLSVTPAEVGIGEVVTISILVTNIGGQEGSYSVVLKINGATEAEQIVTVAAGDSQSVSFTVTREDVASYNVVVDGLSGSFVISAPPPPEKPGNWLLTGGIITGVIVVGLGIFFLVRRRAY
ncbi:hypothetical protein ES707_22675 [subsurface metagenome]